MGHNVESIGVYSIDWYWGTQGYSFYEDEGLLDDEYNVVKVEYQFLAYEWFPQDSSPGFFQDCSSAYQPTAAMMSIACIAAGLAFFLALVCNVFASSKFGTFKIYISIALALATIFGVCAFGYWTSSCFNKIEDFFNNSDNDANQADDPNAADDVTPPDFSALKVGPGLVLGAVSSALLTISLACNLLNKGDQSRPSLASQRI